MKKFLFDSRYTPWLMFAMGALILFALMTESLAGLFVWGWNPNIIFGLVFGEGIAVIVAITAYDPSYFWGYVFMVFPTVGAMLAAAAIPEARVMAIIAATCWFATSVAVYKIKGIVCQKRQIRRLREG